METVKRKSGRRRQFGKPVGNPRPFSEKKIGCGKCGEKKKRLKVEPVVTSIIDTSWEEVV